MAKELLPDALWARIAPLLPREPPKPKGWGPLLDRASRQLRSPRGLLSRRRAGSTPVLAVRFAPARTGAIGFSRGKRRSGRFPHVRLSSEHRGSFRADVLSVNRLGAAAQRPAGGLRAGKHHAIQGPRVISPLSTSAQQDRLAAPDVHRYRRSVGRRVSDGGRHRSIDSFPSSRWVGRATWRDPWARRQRSARSRSSQTRSSLMRTGTSRRPGRSSPARATLRSTNSRRGWMNRAGFGGGSVS
jgi:hypothetical protein